MKIKIGVLFLLVFSVQQADSQNREVSPLEREITLDVVNMPVAKILKQVEKQVRLRFSYNSEITEGLKPITVSFRNKKIAELISLLFDDKIACKIKNKYIILYPNRKMQPHTISKHLSGDKNNNEKNSVKKAIPKDTVVLRSSKNNSNSSLHDPDSMNTDSVSLLPAQLFLINNDTTLLLQEEDTTVTPK